MTIERAVAALCGGAVACAVSWPYVRARWCLSRAKYPSIQGHARLSRILARAVPFYEYDETTIFRSDGAPAEIEARRRHGFERLAIVLRQRAPATLALSDTLEDSISDLSFTRTYRVPFQYAGFVKARLKLGALVRETSGVTFTDLDGNVAYDATGSYGVNVFGYDFYKDCVDAGIERVRPLGPLLGSYHPVIADNVERLKAISGLDEVSFHMSGTEAVMQAVQLARYHTGRSHAVRLCGAYHGWWDGVQPGAGNPRPVRDVYTLKDLDETTLRVLRARRDVACVLVNPLQALHPNRGAPADAHLINSQHGKPASRSAYAAWLGQLREVCSARSIPLIFDEVFVGFRIAHGGAQEYFGVRADLVTYGKTVGGGLPVGVLCGRRSLMKRFSDDRPTDICFARGTFNSHPYVMGAMNEFLRRIETPSFRSLYRCADTVWNARAAALNARLTEAGIPVRVANLVSIWTIGYTLPSRYNWMLQYYLAAEGVALSWVGSGRLVFSHNYSDADFAALMDRFVDAATKMLDDGWWWQGSALSDAAITRQVLREIVAARLKRVKQVRAHPA
jgi:glutamate-1-semialdehyde 2,1-aminomutase